MILKTQLGREDAALSSQPQRERERERDRDRERERDRETERDREREETVGICPTCPELWGVVAEDRSEVAGAEQSI